MHSLRRNLRLVCWQLRMAMNRSSCFPIRELSGEAASSRQRLAGKVAIITGAGGGIGSVTARLFVEEGAMVVLADVDKDTLAASAKELSPDHTHVCHCDVAKEADVAATVAAALARWNRLDIMLNNAAIGGPKNNIFDTRIDDVHTVSSVNIDGVISGTREAAKSMHNAGHGGCIINIGSVATFLGGSAPVSYSISKGAIITLTKCVAYELAPFGIRVNCISPSAVPNQRWVNDLRACGFQGSSTKDISLKLQEHDYFKGPPLTSQMIAQAALFLADDGSGGYISGHNLVIDGGLTCGKNFDPFAWFNKKEK